MLVTTFLFPDLLLLNNKKGKIKVTDGNLLDMTKDDRKIFPHVLTDWDWRRWQELSDNARKLDTALSCCSCRIRGWYNYCDCETADKQKWLDDFLFVRRFAPPCIKPVNKDGALVMHPDGYIMGPYTYDEWLAYCFELFDFVHDIAVKQLKPDWTKVYFRCNDDFVGGNFKYFYPITLIMISKMHGLPNKHGAAMDASRGVDLYETLQPKDLNLSDVLRNKGHMITFPVPHYEYLNEIHKINPIDVDAHAIANKIKSRNLKFKKRVKQMRKANRKLDWKNAMHYLPERKQNFNTWYPKIKNVPMWFDKRQKCWKLPYFYTDKRVEDSQPKLFNSTIEKWLASGAIYILNEDEDVDLITPNVLANVQRVGGPPVEKGKKPRMCHDGAFEKNIEKYSFPCKLDDLRTVQKMMQRDDMLCVSDDQRGFHQQFLSKESRKLTAFTYKKRRFIYRVSPFGSPKIPAVFQRANTIPVNYGRTLGARVNLYLDDRITLDRPENVIDGIGLSSYITTCLSICAGGFISIEKSDLIPKKCQQFLGLIVNSEDGTISVPEEKWKTFRETIEFYLKQNGCTFKELEKLRGKAVSFLLTNPMTKLFLRQMNRIIAQLTKNGMSANTFINFKEPLRRELEEWIKLDFLQMRHQWIDMGLDLNSPPHRVTFTDASSFSAAALIFDGDSQAWHFQRMFSEEQQPVPIHLKEAWAILWMLDEFEEELSDKKLIHFCDNEGVCLAYLGQGTGGCHQLNDEITNIYYKLHKMNSTLKMYWINTKNQLADAKSRTIDWNEEYLPSLYFHRLCRKLKFFPKVDAMATCANTKCEFYITLGKDKNEKCLAFDFFSYKPSNLAGLPFYIFPPKNILSRVANHLLKYYQSHDWLLIFHSFGELPPTIAPLLMLNVTKHKLDKESTIVPAEKRLIIGEEVHWGFVNRKPAETIAILHKPE